ncbi:MAG: histidine phosphatase family protein [archaeon]|jgi:alpha-ribazole phosphatase
MQKIFLFRTGTIVSKENIFLGWLNLPLNEKGIGEAKQISKKLTKENISFAFCSDQTRSKQALLEVVKNHKNTKIIIDHRIRDKNYGIFSGHEKSVFKDYLPNKYHEIHRDYHAHIPKGENMHDLSKRVFAFMNDLLVFMQKEKGNVVICAHTSSLKLIRGYLENLDKREIELIEQSPTTIKEYEVNFE